MLNFIMETPAKRVWFSFVITQCCLLASNYKGSFRFVKFIKDLMQTKECDEVGRNT